MNPDCTFRQLLHNNKVHNVIPEPKITLLCLLAYTSSWSLLCSSLSLCRVMEQHKLSREQWEERIQVWHEEHSGTLKWVFVCVCLLNTVSITGLIYSVSALGGNYNDIGVCPPLQRGCYAGVPKDRPRSGNVRGQLLWHQEQEGNRAVAGGGRPGTQHLWEGRQVSTVFWTEVNSPVSVLAPVFVPASAVTAALWHRAKLAGPGSVSALHRSSCSSAMYDKNNNRCQIDTVLRWSVFTVRHENIWQLFAVTGCNLSIGLLRLLSCGNKSC